MFIHSCFLAVFIHAHPIVLLMPLHCTVNTPNNDNDNEYNPRNYGLIGWAATLGRVELRTGQLPGATDHGLNPWTTRSDEHQWK